EDIMKVNKKQEYNNINNNMLEIQMLGGFSLRHKDYILSGNKDRGRQVWSLLEYLLVNRYKEVSMDRLIQVLWKEDDIKNPANALKNLVYRLRNLLKKSLAIEENDFIVYKHGAYVWNPNLACKIDVDELESAYEKAQQKNLSLDEVQAAYAKVIDTYRGSFLPQSSYKEWVIPLTVYFQRIYMESVERYCDILLAQKDFRTVEEVCRRAIAVDSFVENNHAILIKCLISSNNYLKATEHYNYVCKLFYDELGVKPSDIITGLYQNIVKEKAGLSRDLSSVRENLKEVTDISGALYCNYEIFKMVYRLEARSALRSGKSVLIALLTITEKNGREFPVHKLDKVFDTLKDAIIFSLRKDDIVTRYGRTQFLLVLSNLTYEDGNMVLDRLVRNINASDIGSELEIYGQIQPLDHLEWGVLNANV
ncbi:MAG: BTAD domain-containing putative transcriptional regulator, partial [Bacillota bacterium]